MRLLFCEKKLEYFRSLPELIINLRNILANFSLRDAVLGKGRLMQKHIALGKKKHLSTSV